MITEGEAWTRDQLERLLAARFRPVAVARFLVASQQRANEVRRLRPELARQERTWAAAGAGAWLLLAATGVEPFRRCLRSGLLGWAATVLMLDWHLGMLETAEGRPRNLGPADAATLLRAWLVPAIAGRPSGRLCAAGFATDVLDGRLARATQPTRLGRDLEGLADFAFTVAALRGARRHHRLGRPVVAAETLRLWAGMAYALFTYFGHAQPPDARLLRAARIAAPVRAAGLILACGGRRDIGEKPMIFASTASAAIVARAAISALDRVPKPDRTNGPPGHPGDGPDGQAIDPDPEPMRSPAGLRQCTCED